jgi:tyrosyl-tRNA synthetase
VPAGRLSGVQGSEILDDLVARGLVHDHTDLDALRARLGAGPVTLYAGFDPTADSLHVGHLVPLLLLRRFQDAGHRPIALAGGATGMIGDPSGRSTERTLLDDAVLDANVGAISGQLARFLEFDPGPTGAVLVDNRSWTAGLSVLDFLRDVGKHVTVNAMLAKESVRARVASEHGISYTEFSYMLLQANDYWWLHRHEGCELQVGGSDQWGNITAGIDLVRRRSGAAVHGVTVPLVTRADGQKFGKSAGDNVWLSARRTSPYQLSQYLVQVDDRDVERLLLQLTLLPVDEVAEVVAAHQEAPHERRAQRALARALTALVHGDEAAAAAEQAAGLLFGTSQDTLTEGALATLCDEIPTTRLDPVGRDLLEVLEATDLVRSRSDARRALDAGELWCNHRRLGSPDPLEVGDLWFGRYVLLRRGRKRHHLVVRGLAEPVA